MLTYTCGRGSILLWLHCNTLCTSGSVDDVMSSHNGDYVKSVRRVLRTMDVSQRETTAQKRSELRLFSSVPFCVVSCWLTSLDRKPRRTQRSLAVAASSALRTAAKSAILDCLVSTLRHRCVRNTTPGFISSAHSDLFLVIMSVNHFYSYHLRCPWILLPPVHR